MVLRASRSTISDIAIDCITARLHSVLTIMPNFPSLTNFSQDFAPKSCFLFFFLTFFFFFNFFFFLQNISLPLMLYS